MRVIVGNHVWLAIEEFYVASMRKHPTLDRAVVHAKVKRLINALRWDLGEHYYLFREAEYIERWKRNHWYVFYAEDFHFAFSVEVLPDGKQAVVVKDARHHLLYHD